MTPPRRIFDSDAGIYGRWLPGATLNVAWKRLDRHVAAGRDDRAALLHDSPVTGTSSILSYSDLLGPVEAMAGISLDFGLRMDVTRGMTRPLQDKIASGEHR